MSQNIYETGADKHHSINNQTLLFVRWMAVIGQSAAVIITHYVIDINLPLFPIWGCIFSSVLVNLYAQIRYGNQNLQPLQASVFMGYDILQLAALLWLTGGIGNPFAVMIIAPASVAATLLPLRYTLGLIGLALAGIVAISLHSIPLQWPNTGVSEPDFPDLYLLGGSVAISLSLIFICLYIWRISSESRATARAYQIAQLALARQQELSSLGALSAAAAHELGSPLSTLAVISNDLNKILKKNDEIHIKDISDDIVLLHDEIQKCQDILRNLGASSTHKTIRDFDALTLDVLVTALAEPYDRSYPELDFNIRFASDSRRDKVYVKKTPELDFGIGNILQNAFKFANTCVEVILHINENQIRLTVRDDGPGFSNAILRRIGEPYNSDALASQKPDDVIARETGLGLGLGVFIAQNLLSRYDARLDFRNRDSAKGAEVTMIFDRSLIEIQSRV